MSRRGIGRTEVGIGIGVVVVLCIIAIPLTMGSSKTTKIDQVRDNVALLRAIEIEQMEAFGSYVAASAAPRGADEVDTNPIQWKTTSGFDRLAWAPSTNEVYGSYRIMADKDGFKVVGECDLDGDGVRAVFEATHEAEVSRVSAEDVF
jgi:hypothetical protein